MDGRIVGGSGYAEENDGKIELRGFWIAPRFRGKHLGELVTETMRNYILKEYPEHAIYCQTISTNEKIIGILKDLNFILNPENVKDEKDCDGMPVKLLYFEIRPAVSVAVATFGIPMVAGKSACV